MKFLNCIPRRKSWTHQNTQATTEKSLFFDDLVNAPDRIQSKIANHWTDGRHHGISPIYLSQSYYDVPQKIRLNCSHMILYPPATKKHVDLIAKKTWSNQICSTSWGHLSFCFLIRKRKALQRILMREFEKFS